MAEDERRGDLWFAAVAGVWRGTDEGDKFCTGYGSAGIYGRGCALHRKWRRAVCDRAGLACGRRTEAAFAVSGQSVSDGRSLFGAAAGYAGRAEVDVRGRCASHQAAADGAG